MHSSSLFCPLAALLLPALMTSCSSEVSSRAASIDEAQEYDLATRLKTDLTEDTSELWKCMTQQNDLLLYFFYAAGVMPEHMADPADPVGLEFDPLLGMAEQRSFAWRVDGDRTMWMNGIDGSVSWQGIVFEKQDTVLGTLSSSHGLLACQRDEVARGILNP